MPSLKEKKGDGTADAADAARARKVLSQEQKPDRLDYSRFNEIGEDDREERLQTGDVSWEELKKEEKKQVWDAREQMDAVLEQKRREEDDWKRQLKEKPSDLSWVKGQHFASYEAFCVGRVEATLKKSGNEAFKRGDLGQAQVDWEAGVGMLLALGTLTPEVLSALCILRNNLAQLHIKRGEWGKVKDLTDRILDTQPSNEKALYRRAQAFFTFSLWEKCEADLEVLLKHYPQNKDAAAMLRQVQHKTGKDRKKLAGKAVSDICAGLAELCPDGTVRKLRIEEYGEGDPDEEPKWLQPQWLSKGSEKVVVTCQMIISSHGGEELYNSKEYRPFPETKQARDELKEYMEMVNFLDQEAGKAPRLVGDFYRKVKKRPVRWFLGDPGMYKGFDLAVRTMKPKERAIFEVDQPMLAASVEQFYEGIGFHSTIAGLPQLQYHIEEQRLQILEDEMTEKELELDNKTQRGVKVEITLLGYIIFRDLSPNGDGSRLHAVIHPGVPEAPASFKSPCAKNGDKCMTCGGSWCQPKCVIGAADPNNMCKTAFDTGIADSKSICASNSSSCASCKGEWCRLGVTKVAGGAGVVNSGSGQAASATAAINTGGFCCYRGNVFAKDMCTACEDVSQDIACANSKGCGTCGGTWCAGPRCVKAFSDTKDPCHSAYKGNVAPVSDYCAKTEQRCNDCGGAWCSANDITFDDGDKFDPDATEDSGAESESESDDDEDEDDGPSFEPLDDLLPHGLAKKA